jgi:glutaredoxin-related protein
MANIVHSGSVRARIAEIIKLHPAALFMRGSPSTPQCGFSAATAVGAVGAGRMSRERSVEDGAISPLIAHARWEAVG